MRRRFGFYTPNEKYEAIINRLLRPDDHWLDLGGGRSLFPQNPKLALSLSQRCSRVVGVDPSSNIHENPYAHERFEGYLEDYEGQRDFDLISLRMVAEHVEDPASLASQISKSLKVGGYVVILTVWSYAPITWISWMTPHYVHYPIKKFFWGGEEKDTFPVVYKMNTLSKLKRLFFTQGLRPEMLELVADCSATMRWPKVNSLELSTWRVLHSLSIPYPESCILAVFRKSSN
ncbi:MAG: class I SAM-dependent methyltransferase [Planctomycetota bacterium]